MSEWSPRANEIFLAAIDIAAPADRARFVEEACAGDPALRAGVQRLLDAAERAAQSRFLESPPSSVAGGGTAAGAAASPDDSGAVVGNYRLVERVGEGGFGVVYAADQTHPVRRQVAVKIVKPGMDSRQVIARFEAERQALAVMDHPNIAKVFDAGTTDAGRPYFVMELVRGLPITRYCDQERLTPRQRLELFVPVCQAVQHAHQKGVIHRDLKPSNILVALYDGRPVPKVIDFGVAKAMSVRPAERAAVTEIGGIIGTLEYMAPEQAEPNTVDVDTRADVYSLGVVLYELLAGSPPFTSEQLRSAAFDQVLRMIREVEPAKPSTRLSTASELPAIAARRQVEPDRLRRLVSGELDWIVMKALEKDRARRYATANGLAMDLLRHLADEPVTAAAPSRAYRLRKFVRRHRGGVAAGSAIALLLLAGTAGTTAGLLEARRQRDAARRQEATAREQAAIAQAVSDFQSGMLASADPGKLLGDKVTVLQAVAGAVKELDAGRLRDQPAVEAAVRQTIGQTLRALGRYDQAEPNLRRAVELRRASAGGAADRALAEALSAQANLLADQGRLADAEEVFAEALEIQRESGRGAGATGPEDVDVAKAAQNLAWVLARQGKLERAIPMLRDALAVHRRAIPPDDPTLAKTLSQLGLALRQQRDLAAAEPLLREAVEVNRRVLPSGHPDLGMSLSNLALVLQDQGRHADAEPLLRESLSISRAALPAGHPDLATPLNNLAHTLTRQSKLAEAEALHREALEIRRAMTAAGGPPPLAGGGEGSTDTSLAISLNNLADVLRLRGEHAEAQALMREALDSFRRALPAGHPTIGTATTNLGWSLLDQGQPADAEPLLREAWEIKRAALPPGHPEALSALGGLAIALQRQSKFAEAEPLFLEAERLTRGTARHPRTMQFLATLHAEWDQAEPGRGHDRQAAEWRAKAVAATRPTTAPTTATTLPS